MSPDAARPGLARMLLILAAVAALLLGTTVTATAATPVAATAKPRVTSSTVTVTPRSHLYGTSSSATIVVKATGGTTPKGLARFYLDNKTWVTLELDGSGQATARIATGLSIGRHDIRVFFIPASGSILGGSHGDVGFYVTKMQVGMAVALPNSIAFGALAAINVHFSGARVTPATATLWLGNKVIGRLAVRGSGDAFFRPSANWNAGHQGLVVKYSGNAYNAESSKSIVVTTSKAITTLDLTAPSSLPYLRSSTATVTVTGAGARPSGTVDLLVDGRPRGSAKLGSGHASLVLPALSGGGHVIRVTYSGDSNHTGSSATVTRIAANSPCPASARACVDLTHSMTWLQSGGKVTYGPVSMASGRAGYRTRPGTFTVYWKHIDHHSSEFNNAPMPYSAFFDGGIAFHQGSIYIQSHGCIHLTQSAAIAYWNALHIGDQVYVYGHAPD